MMMRVNANTVNAARVSNKNSAAAVAAPRRAVVVAASKESKVSASSSIQEGARTGLAAVSAFCLGVSLLVSPVQPAQAVLPADNGAGLIKSGENALPQPLNKLKDSASEYKDPSAQGGQDVVKSMANGLDNETQNVTSSVTSFLSSKASAAKDAIGDKVGDIGSSTKETAQNVKLGAKDLASDVKENVKGANYVQSGLNGAVNDNEKAGGQTTGSANAFLTGNGAEARNVKSPSTADPTKGINNYQQSTDNIKAAAEKINSGERSPLA